MDGMGSDFCFLGLAKKKSVVEKLWYVGNCVPLACSFICLMVLESFLQGRRGDSNDQTTWCLALILFILLSHVLSLELTNRP